MSEQTRTPRFRSPPYPTLSLQRALERADQLYRQERDHLVPLASAARAWNMSPTSSGPVVTAAALRQYGLLDDDGSGEARKVRVTHDALRIILDKTPASPTRMEALRRAFLGPKIFSELWLRWKADLPSEQTMINYLVLERKLNNLAPFSEQSASELLANYRASLPFACPEEGSNLAPSTDESEDAMESTTDYVPDSPAIPTPISRTAQPLPAGKGTVTERERVVFVEEGGRDQYLKVIACGDVDDILLDALSAYVERQKRRLTRPN